MTLNEKRKMAQRSMQTVANQSLPSRCARVGLFIGEVKGLITMLLMPLTTYHANRVSSQRGNLDYYIKALFYNTPMRH
jgi:hypothetical protein